MNFLFHLMIFILLTLGSCQHPLKEEEKVPESRVSQDTVIDVAVACI